MGKLILRLIGLFPELEGEKNEEALMARGLELKKREKKSDLKGPFSIFEIKKTM